MSRDARSLFIVTKTLEIGGTEQHLAKVLPELVRRGWRISLFALDGEGPLAEPLRQAGIAVRLPWAPVPGRGRALRILRLAVAGLSLLWQLRRIRPALVHFYLPEAYLVGGLCALIAGVGIKVMSRRSGNAYQAKRPHLARIERWLHRRMALVLANSRSVAEDLQREGVPEERIRLIYSGIEVERRPADVRSAMRRELGIADDELVVMTVANLLPYKGHADLLEALALSRGRLPGAWRLVAVGRDTGYGAQLRQRATSLGLAGHVLWLGERRDVARVLSAADIGVLASHEEGFSNAVLEGMAAGLPMVVTAVGGNTEAMADGISGLIVPPECPTELGAAVARLAADPVLRAALGRAARETVESRFRSADCIKAYDEMYRGLIEGRASAYASGPR